MTSVPCFVAPVGPARKCFLGIAPASPALFCSSTIHPVPHARRSRHSGARSLHMGLFGLGVPEIAVIAGVAILVFGPGKIAEMGKDLGGLAGSVKKATVEFQEAMSESLAEADREIEAKKSVKLEKGDADSTKA